MELAAIITTVFVVILQIITIALVVGTRKIVRDQAGKINSALSNEKTGEKRERDFRIQNKRPVQEQRQKPTAHQSTNTGSVDTVEKSLRDINLKLKNAERDQEFARRRVQENFSKEPNTNRRHNGNGNERPSGNERNNRGGRDNRDHRHGNDRNRDRRSGNNWQDRNRSREPMNFGAPQNEEVQITENQNLILNQEQLQSQPQEAITQTQIAQTPITSEGIHENSPELTPVDFSSDDNLQHGRKIMVKRRMLKEDGSPQSEGSDESSSFENSTAGVGSETSVHSESSDVEKASEGEIRFGRR